MHFSLKCVSESAFWKEFQSTSIFSHPRQPQREALMNTRIISVSIWSYLRLISVIKKRSTNAFSCFCQLKLPQQVALTEFKFQVNAHVRGILMRYNKCILNPVRADLELLSWWIMWREPGTSEVSKTSPTSSTYCIHNSSQCSCFDSVGDK